MTDIQNLKLSIDQKTDLLQQLKAFETRSSNLLREEFIQKSNIRSLVVARSKHIDCLLMSLWQHLEINHEFSLIAVGGYGRGELHPFSDIDLLILTKKTPNKEQSSKLSTFITLLWDTGLIIGHAIRDLKQCISLAKEDITVVTNLMESRLLLGAPNLFEKMLELSSPHNIWNATDFYNAKTEEKEQRYKKFDGSSYDLEPNVKSSPGGLRDVQTVTWIAQRCFFPKTLFQLVKQRVITRQEYQSLVKSQQYIWKVRFALHLVSGKPEDRLLFDYQKKTAEMMGYEDEKNKLAVEKLMKKYYRSARIVRNIADILLQVMEENLNKSIIDQNVISIDDNYQILNQRIHAINPEIFNEKPSHLLKVFHLVAKTKNIRGLSASTLRAIRASRNKITRQFAKSKTNKKLFIDFWNIQHHSSRAMFLMKRSGVLSDYLPSFKKITGQMQYDMFHSYTVDEHTLFLLKNLVNFTNPEKSQKFPLCMEIMQRQSQPSNIYLAGLFHDIGKGRGGDHSELGAQEVKLFCEKHNIPKEQTELISWLVANHLTMSLIAQKRDTSDPKVVGNFAELVKTSQRLELLYVLTVADIRATSHNLWNSWKDSLLRELYLNTLTHLTEKSLIDNQQIKDQKPSLEIWEKNRNQALDTLITKGFTHSEINNLWQQVGHKFYSKRSPRAIVWQTQLILESRKNNQEDIVIGIRDVTKRTSSEVFVYTKDKDDLFATLTATLNQLGININAANIYTDKNGYCYDSFLVLDEKNQTLKDQSLIQKIKQSIRENINKIDTTEIEVRQRTPRQFKHFKVKTSVKFYDDEFSGFTGLEIKARSQPGFLAAVARAFKDCNIKIHDARITTLGETAEDIFIVSHRNNQPITDLKLRNEICEAIKQRLAI